MAAAKDGELRHFDAEQAFLKANIDEEINIEIPEKFQESPGAVGRLNKAIYGLVEVRRCWNNTFCDDMTTIGFESRSTVGGGRGYDASVPGVGIKTAPSGDRTA